MGEWFEDEALWRDFYPFLFAEERLRLGADEVAQALALAGIAAPAGKAALDLCCGPGRHAVPLAQRGLRVTGVDRAALLLDRARERASLAAVDVEWVQADMREFRRPAAYDLALSLFTSFGYFAAPEDDLLVLAQRAPEPPAGRRPGDGLDGQGESRASLPADAIANARRRRRAGRALPDRGGLDGDRNPSGC